MSGSIRSSGQRRAHRAAPAAPPSVPLRRTPATHIVDTARVLDAAGRAALRREMRKLSRFSDRIHAVQVTVTAPHRFLHREVIRYEVHLRVSMPMQELEIRRRSDVSLATAIQAAFKAAGRIVQDYVGEHQLPVPATMSPTRGRVLHLFPYEGYGFIAGDDGTEIYFHRNSVLGGKFDRLDVGTRVRYAVEAGLDGPQASSVAVARG